MRKLSIMLAIAVVASVMLITPGIALANFAIHGGYSMDTDSCAGCHRAHTATSEVTWNNGTENRSALLISTATQLYEFCFSCHGSDASGAATNVWDGEYEGTANGTLGAQLNAGTFSDAIVGMNTHTYQGGEWGAWGGGTTGREGIISLGYGDSTDHKVTMTCGSCHDVHGSSNYRLLKDIVQGPGAPVTVGGYVGGNPDPFVISNEPGFPESGFALGDAGKAQIALYKPNYTTPMYAKAPSLETSRGISGWCAACHTQYINTATAYDANDTSAGETWGFTMRHRHPVNVPLSNYNGGRPLNLDNQAVLPVGQSAYDFEVGSDDWIDCLTCHRAHGTPAVMEGWATDQSDGWITAGGAEGPAIQYPGTKNAFLRQDNRGVCQTCHDK